MNVPNSAAYNGKSTMIQVTGNPTNLNTNELVAPSAGSYSTNPTKPAVISIKANHTTPYRWKVVNAPKGIEIQKKYKRSPNSARRLGRGGTLNFTIKPGTCKPGSYQIELGKFRLGSTTPVRTKSFFIDVQPSAPDETTTLSIGESATIGIPANYSTPFKWKVMSAPSGVSVTSQYKSNPNPNRFMGVGGVVDFTITPHTCPPGTYTIQLGNFSLMDDSQPWNTKTIQVTVK